MVNGSDELYSAEGRKETDIKQKINKLNKKDTLGSNKFCEGNKSKYQLGSH